MSTHDTAAVPVEPATATDSTSVRRGSMSDKRVATSPRTDAAPFGRTEGGGPEVSSFALDNGLDVVVIPDRRVPVVTHMVWYRNGSADDPLGQSGIAHFLEHLMFKGTERHPAGEFSQVVSALGGQENAFTSFDYTAYFQRVAKEHLGTMMEFEADRMIGLVLDDAVVAPGARRGAGRAPHAGRDRSRGAAVGGHGGGAVRAPSLRHPDHRLDARDRDARPRARARLLPPLLHARERHPGGRRRRRRRRGPPAGGGHLRAGGAARRASRSAGARASPSRAPPGAWRWPTQGRAADLAAPLPDAVLHHRARDARRSPSSSSPRSSAAGRPRISTASSSWNAPSP